MADGEDFKDRIGKAIDLLKSKNAIFDAGLTDLEIEQNETEFGFKFPPDLRAFLQTALPIRIESKWGADSFSNWRSGDRTAILDRLKWPFDSMAFDIENNVFWADDWGPKPVSLTDALGIARQAVDAAPNLIPICSHRYLPAEPLLAGNPVFSVHQTDIIYYGCDLWDYFVNEFGPKEERGKRYKGMSRSEYTELHRPIRFWSKLSS